MNYKIKLNNCYCNTNGSGLWSNLQKRIKILVMEICYLDDEENFGELRLYFNPKIWNIEKYGLIYTDELFLDDFIKYLNKYYVFNINKNDLSYSEQGMQGYDFVSCDINSTFIQNYHAIPQIQKQRIFK